MLLALTALDGDADEALPDQQQRGRARDTAPQPPVSAGIVDGDGAARSLRAGKGTQEGVPMAGAGHPVGTCQAPEIQRCAQSEAARRGPQSPEMATWRHQRTARLLPPPAPTARVKAGR